MYYIVNVDNKCKYLVNMVVVLGCVAQRMCNINGLEGDSSQITVIKGRISAQWGNILPVPLLIMN
jgi:hypothetical protein